MNINLTSEKRIGASPRGFATAQSAQITTRNAWKSLATVAFGLLLSVPGLAQTQYRFSTIDVDVPGATGTEANGNSTHEIVGDYNDAAGKTHGFVLNKGVFTTIDAPGAEGGTVINGINASGQLAGTYFDGAGTPHAFFEDKGYFTLLFADGRPSQGGFINARGQAVGFYIDASGILHGFIWSNGTFSTLDAPGGPGTGRFAGTVAFGINDVGEVVGSYDGLLHDFLRSSKGNFTTFTPPYSNRTIAEGINNAGTIVGWYRDQANFIHGFVLNKGVFTTVDVPGSRTTEIQSINAQGEIVGLYFDSKGVEHGFLGVPVR